MISPHVTHLLSLLLPPLGQHCPITHLSHAKLVSSSDAPHQLFVAGGQGWGLRTTIWYNLGNVLKFNLLYINSTNHCRTYGEYVRKVGYNDQYLLI